MKIDHDKAYADTIRAEGEALAQRTLRGRDESMDGGWRDAGYNSAEEAAAVCIGDGYDPEVMAIAMPIVAKAIR